MVITTGHLSAVRHALTRVSTSPSIRLSQIFTRPKSSTCKRASAIAIALPVGPFYPRGFVERIRAVSTRAPPVSAVRVDRCRSASSGSPTSLVEIDRF